MPGQLTRRLDRPGGRALLAVGASAYLTLRERRRCTVRHVDGAWVHRHGDRAIVESRVVLAPPEELDRRVDELFLHEHRPGPGEVVVDVGAGVGRETVHLAHLVGPTGRVIAVEAHPGTAAMLRSAVAANHLANVTVVHAALAAEDGTVHLTDTEQHTQNRVAAEATGIAVPARALAGLLDELGIAAVDLLKVNIEGAEAPSLTAFAPELARIRHAVISCHDFVADLTGDESYRTLATVDALFRAAGFTVSRRGDDPRPYARDTLYATAPATSR